MKDEPRPPFTDLTFAETDLPFRLNSMVRIVTPEAIAKCGFDNGVVVGIFRVDDQWLVDAYGFPLGTVRVIVEGSAGFDGEVTANDVIVEDYGTL